MPRRDRPHRHEPDDDTRALATLAALQRARRENDYPAAARAECELERLGYVVRVVRLMPDRAQRTGGEGREVADGRRQNSALPPAGDG